MLGRIKDTLRRFPGLYGGLQRAYYKALYVSETKLLGSRIHAWVWRYLRPATTEEFEAGIAHPHRRLIEEAVRALHPVGDVLEIGCNAGANLVVLARALPEARLQGLDINTGAIALGRRWTAERGMTNVSLGEGSFDDLAGMADRSVDVVMTDAVLMYVGPDRIGAVLRDMARIARRGLVVNEWSLPPEDERLHLWYDLHWVHNFHQLLREAAPGAPIRGDRIPADVWGGAGWTEYGTLFVVGPIAPAPVGSAPAREGRQA